MITHVHCALMSSFGERMTAFVEYDLDLMAD